MSLFFEVNNYDAEIILELACSIKETLTFPFGLFSIILFLMRKFLIGI